MNTRIFHFILLAMAVLTSCATPRTTLEHPQTKAIVNCGGTATGSALGGYVGYNIQKDNDEKCVRKYQDLGYKIKSRTE